MSLPQFEVDFNELIERDLILLSKGDLTQTVDGQTVTLVEGMEIAIHEDDTFEGEVDAVIATGRVERNTTPYATHVKWCCRIDSRGIRHLSVG